MLRAAWSAALLAVACNTPRSPPPLETAAPGRAPGADVTGAGAAAADGGWEMVPPAGPFRALDEACRHLLAGEPAGGRCRLEGEPAGAAELPRRIAGGGPIRSAVLGVAGTESRSDCVLALEAEGDGWFVLPLGRCQGTELGMAVDDLRFVPQPDGGAVSLTMTRKVANGLDVDDDDPVPTTCTQELVVCAMGPASQPRCTRGVELARREFTCRAGVTPGGISWQWRLEARVGEDGVVRLAEAVGPLPPERRALVGAHRLEVERR